MDEEGVEPLDRRIEQLPESGSPHGRKSAHRTMLFVALGAALVLVVLFFVARSFAGPQ